MSISHVFALDSPESLKGPVDEARRIASNIAKLPKLLSEQTKLSA